MRYQTKQKFRFLLLFVALFAAIWFFWDTPVVYPLKLFVVLLHEISHGFASILTGGEIRSVEITPQQGGVCRCPGGNVFLTLSAGYLGSLLWGGLMIVGAESLKNWSAWLTAAVAILVTGSTLLYVNQPFAAAFGIAFGAALFVVSLRAGATGNRVTLYLLGLTSCLYAVLDIKSDILDRPALTSDARLLAELTGVPTLVWGAAWIVTALLFCALLLHWLWRRA
jgi:hypothetical protein